jgi:ABC-type multidrug transport system ATPase subunit
MDPNTSCSSNENDGVKSSDAIIPINSSLNMSRKSISVENSCIISCRDLCYTITTSKKGKKTVKHVLSGIDAVFKPGRLTAIMGASGAGKTSLLNYLSGEASNAQLSGEVAVNGFPASTKDLKKVSAFVFQDDVILETMTVREAITMSALLRLPSSVSKKEREQRIDDIIEILSLTKCQNTKIGSPEKKGISGGERKRTSMAMDMVVNPTVLMLDEPTSGLDTFTAFNVMQTLADLAHKQNRTIVATIHQPSSEIFHLLDDLLLLSGGKVVYYGPAKEAVNYFTKLNYSCPRYTNPADYFFMEVLNETPTKSEKTNSAGADTLEQSKSRVTDIINSWHDSEEHSKLLQDISSLKDDTSEQRFAASTTGRAKASFCTQFGYLVIRAGKNLMRNFMIAQLRLFQSIFIGLIIGFIYKDVRSKDALTQTSNRLGALYFYCVNQFMGSAMGVVTTFVAEKNVFLREYTNGYYSLPAYFFSKTLVELPHQILMPVIVLLVSYWLVGFRSGAEYVLKALLVVILVALNGAAVGTLSGALFKDINTGMAVLSMCLLPFIVFSGLMVNNNQVPLGFKWIPHIAPTRYGFIALARNELQDYKFPTCVPIPQADCLGNSSLKYNDIGEGPEYWSNVFFLIGIYFIVMTMAYLAMFRLIFRKK